MTDSEYTPELWTYLGEVLTRSGSVAHRWRDADGSELEYSKRIARMTRVGCVYTVDVKRDADGRAAVRLESARWTGKQADDAAAIEAVAHSRKRAIDEHRFQKSAKADSVKTAAQPLLDMASGMTYSQRHALAVMVTDLILGVKG